MPEATAADSDRLPSEVFFGREAELDRLLAAVAETVQGRGRVALIAGEPGIGKSRLADQLAIRARKDGIRVLVGHCWEGVGAPAYWPWVQVFRTIIRTTDDRKLRDQLGSGAGDVAQMVGELRERFADLPPAGEIESESARFQLFDSATTFLRRASQAHPLLVVIEDIHAADMSTMLYLRFVANELADVPVMVLCTYRAAEWTANPALGEALADIGRQPTTTTLNLSGLGEDSVRQFIEVSAGIQPRLGLVNAIVRETRGNPLFVGEAVRLLAAEGRLEDVGTGQALELPLPAGIRDVILQRIRHLEAGTADLLIRAAAIGPEFETEVLRRIAGTRPQEVLDRLGEAARTQLVGPVPGTLGRFRFTHDLIRETLYDELLPGQRIGLHAQIAETLESLAGSTPEAYVAELAYHYMEAARGDDSIADAGGRSAALLAVRYARQAGDVALRSLAYEEAARLYRMGLAVLELHRSADSEQSMDMRLRLGEAEARAGDLPTARQTYLAAAELARRLGAAETLARAALGYGGRFLWARVGNDRYLIPLLQDALVMLGGTDDRLRVRLLTRLACAWRSERERQDQRRALSQQALAMARDLGDPATIGYALEGFFWASYVQDNADERLAVAEELLAVAEAAGDAERMIDAHTMLGLVLLDLGRTTDARTRFDTVVTLARELRQPSQLWLISTIQVTLALMEGNYTLAEKAMAHEMRQGRPVTTVEDDVSAARMHRFLLRREQGRGLEDEASVRESAAQFPWYPVHRAALACLLIDAGRTDEARAVVAELAADDFKALYPDNEWLLGMALVSDACAALGDASAAAALYRQLLPFEGGHAIGHAEGSLGAVDRYLGLLAASLGREADAQRHFEAGIAVNEKIGATPWVAHTQADLAALLRRRGAPTDIERALTLERTALQAAERIGMTALRQSLAPAEGPKRPDGVPGMAVFHREGDYWTVSFDGLTVRTRDSRGMRLLARLLAEPGREMHALELAGAPAAAGTAGVAEVTGDASAGFGPVLDDEAKRAYRARLAELAEEAAQAEAWNDAERAARVRREKEALEDELVGAVGLGKRDRVVGSSAERARVSVTRAIRGSLKRIAKQHPALGRHLGATVRTGAFCVYQPDPRVPVHWQL